MKIRYLLFFLPMLWILYSCGYGDRGEVMGRRASKSWFLEKPYGMVLIPEGTFIMGSDEEDDVSAIGNLQKTVSIKNYFMDDTETTNAEYRQFVFWVRDSIVRTKLGSLAMDLAADAANAELVEDEEGIFAYKFKASDTTNYTEYQKYMLNNYGSVSGSDPVTQGGYINWDVPLEWNKNKFPDRHYSTVMDSLYLPLEDSFNGERMLDPKKMVYKYSWLDKIAAAKDRASPRRKYIKEEQIEIYPDTTVWIRDYSFSYNDPMHDAYFWHQSYEDYPVVGVNWYQATAFCHWKTKKKNDYLKKRGANFKAPSFRLPTETEWEYAARGGLDNGTYPWGGPYTVSDKGCFLANFKPVRGDYAIDGHLYTSKAYSYNPNGYGLYNMAGNVSEWTSSSYNENTNAIVVGMNPNMNDPKNKRKVIKGGSWKDVAYFLRVATKDYEYADSLRSYIGFRTVQDYLGAGR